MSIINQIKAAQSKREVRTILEDKDPSARQHYISEAIEILDFEIESDIRSENIQIALYKMSHVVMLEDELHITERFIFKQSAAVR